MYKGEAVLLDELLYQPNNSLVKQAYHPQMLDMLSLAGFGMLAWDETSYHPDVPFSYRSVNIPVFDQNLKELAEKLRVTTLLAHVRGVVFHHNPTVGEQNLHPFRYRGYRLALAHNGYLAEFDRMRFALLEHIKPEIANLIRGNSDTEWIYALLLSQLDDPRAALGSQEIVHALQKMLSVIREVRRQFDIQVSSPLNLFISDGSSMVATRFAFDYGCYDMQCPDEIRHSRHLFLSVWYTTGKSYGLHDDEWKMIGGPMDTGGSVIVSSEPLTRDTSTWFEVPEYSAMVCAIDESGKQHLSVTFLDV
jgi:predicted glutamine amidotransferase